MFAFFFGSDSSRRQYNGGYGMRMHERMRRHRRNQDLCNIHNKDCTIFPFIMLILISILGGASIVVMADIFKVHSSSSSDSPTDVTTTNLTAYSITNNYGEWDRSSMLPYGFLSDAILIEPHKNTTITFEQIQTGCLYNWSLMRKSNDDLVNGSSTDGSILINVAAVGEYDFFVMESCGNVMERQLRATVWVKYVRREISTLTDSDREAFLNAFHKLWVVSTTMGQLLYGDRYKSVNYFATLHNDGGGNSVCDEFHGGLGFLNNHMFLSAYLEQSLQMVDPAVALHYMDYTKYFESAEFENHLSSQLDGGSWTNLLSSTFFGENDPITGRIMNGRWGNTSIPYMTSEFFIAEAINPNTTFFPSEEVAWLERTAAHLNSPYGLLRSPWNYNPSPYLTRYGSVFGINNDSVVGPSVDLVFKAHRGVSCDDFTQFFTMVKYQPLENYLIAIEDGTHGTFHFTFGGVGGPPAAAAIDMLMNTYNFSYSNIGSLAISAQSFNKKHLAQMNTKPLACSASPWQSYALTSSARPREAGGPNCTFVDACYADEDGIDELIDDFFKSDVDPFDSVKTRLARLTFAEKIDVMEIIANMFPYDGDLAGSGAALDPLFWVAHGAVERVFQKAMFSDIFSDTILESCNHCSGHNASSPKAWLEGYYFADESVVPETLSNAELTNILNPTTNEYRDLINFVYDSSSFDYCASSDAWFQ